MDVGRTRHVRRITNPEESGSYDAGGVLDLMMYTHYIYTMFLHTL